MFGFKLSWAQPWRCNNVVNNDCIYPAYGLRYANSAFFDYANHRRPLINPPVSVAGNTVKILASFTYLGSKIHSAGSCEMQLRCRVYITHQCLNQLNRHVASPLPQKYACITSISASSYYIAQKPGRWRSLFRNVWIRFKNAGLGRILGVLFRDRFSNAKDKL